MSQKLPVGDVMNEAVQFGLHRWATVLQYSWAPALFSLLLFGLYFVALFEISFFESVNSATSFEEVKGALRLSVPMAIVGVVVIYLFMGLLFCGVAASLFRLVALGEERPGFIQMRMDGPALRVFLSYIILTIISAIIFLAVFLLAMVLAGEGAFGFFDWINTSVPMFQAAEQGGSNDLEVSSGLMGPTQAVSVAILFALIMLIYVNVKLAPFPAGSAAENRLLLFGSISMTFGHAWSIFGIFVLYVLFIIVLSVIYGLADSVFGMLAELLALQGSVFALVAIAINIIAIAVAVFFQLFTMGLQAAVPAIIYRRLKTGE